MCKLGDKGGIDKLPGGAACHLKIKPAGQVALKTGAA
jgi:hypothetical protein